jgi:hypothetical protein
VRVRLPELVADFDQGDSSQRPRIAPSSLRFQLRSGANNFGERGNHAFPVAFNLGQYQDDRRSREDQALLFSRFS